MPARLAIGNQCRRISRGLSLMGIDHVPSDALVFLGATGDLAYKKIFPSLQAMVKRGKLNIPVIGVAKSGWNLEQFRQRAKDSLKHHGHFDTGAFEELSKRLLYVDGDYG